MFLAVRRLDLASLENVLSSVSTLPWLPLAIASYLAGHVVRGMRCRLLVRREASLRLVTASNIVVVGYAANNVFPARLGELVRAGMLAERTGIPVAQSLVITFIERVLDGLAILGLLVIGTMREGAPLWAHHLVRVALAVFGGASLVMMFAAHSPGIIVGATSRLGNKLGTKWHDRVVRLATSITNAGACLRDPRDLVKLALYSIVIWVFETGLFLAILPAFGLEASFPLAALAMSVTNLGLLVPSSPGFIGPFHFFCARAVMSQGVPEATAFAYATVVHLAFYVPVTIWGAVSMLWYGVEVGATAAMTRSAQASGTTRTVNGLTMHALATIREHRPREETSAFITALVEALVTSPGRKADASALKDSAEFVRGQLSALPPQLGLMLSAGLTFFRFATRVTHLRGYCELPLEKRRAWTTAWAESRWPLFRKLMKPVRATALLAYHDHAAVRRSADRAVSPSALVRKASHAEAIP
jgi:glycosyltransferase 2 family protein